MVKPQKRTQLNCKRCGHIWLSKILPKKCPVCHNNWRFKKKIKISKTKRRKLKLLDNLEKNYGKNATLKNILEDIEKKESEK